MPSLHKASLAAVLVAIIKKVNQISVKCFDKCGFIFDREEGEYNFYKKIV